jgi:hypothetical protein
MNGEPLGSIERDRNIYGAGSWLCVVHVGIDV